MKIIAWYFFVIQLMGIILRPFDVDKSDVERTSIIAMVSIIVRLPLLYLAFQLTFGNVL